MPAEFMEKSNLSPEDATPASPNSSPVKLKTVSEHRKSSKPIMEKRRRARINESLGQLKILILDALKKDSSRHSKLEKADILEMTVKHLRNLQRFQMTVVHANPSVIGKYRAGFSECMNEVTRFLSSCDGVQSEAKTQLLGHLASCESQINTVNYPAQSYRIPACSPRPAFGQPAMQMQQRLPGKGATGINVSTDAANVYQGFQIVQATDGQLAFLIPNATFALNVPLVSMDVHSGGTPVSVSRGASVDSVWRPW